MLYTLSTFELLEQELVSTALQVGAQSTCDEDGDSKRPVEAAELIAAREKFIGYYRSLIDEDARWAADHVLRMVTEMKSGHAQIDLVNLVDAVLKTLAEARRQVAGAKP